MPKKNKRPADKSLGGVHTPSGAQGTRGRPTKPRVTAPETHIICFRVPRETLTKLEERVTQRPVVGVASPHQLARKMVMDFVSGELVYLDEGAVVRNPVLG